MPNESDPKLQPDQSTDDVVPVQATPVAPGGRPGEVAPADPQQPESTTGTGGVLDDTALGRGVQRLPEYFKDYGNWLVVALLVLAALLWWNRLRGDTADQNRVAARVQLAEMERAVQLVRSLARVAPDMTADQVSEQVAELDGVMAQAGTIVQDAAEADGLLARAERLRGDYHWYVATLPTPRPSTRPADEVAPLPVAEDRLAEAEKAYRQTVEAFPEQGRNAYIAQFGLAAVAEERGNFEAARAAYDALLADDTLPPMPRSYAKLRKDFLDRLPAEPRPETPLDLGLRLDESMPSDGTSLSELLSRPDTPTTRPGE